VQGAGHTRVVVVYAGQALINPAPLCGSEEALLHVAAVRKDGCKQINCSR